MYCRLSLSISLKHRAIADLHHIWISGSRIMATSSLFTRIVSSSLSLSLGTGLSETHQEEPCQRRCNCILVPIAAEVLHVHLWLSRSVHRTVRDTHGFPHEEGPSEVLDRWQLL